MEQAPQSKKAVGFEVKKSPSTYLYHMVPADMRGTVLHPLSTLKELHPELYAVNAEKYRDRQHIMEEFIPALECVWNDVIHLSPIDPRELKQVLIESGMRPKEMNFYQIDPLLLDPKKTTIYLFPQKEGPHDELGQYRDYDSGKVDEHADIPESTKKYYKQMVSNGEKPLLFMGIPHVLHKGSIDISSLQVITV